MIRSGFNVSSYRWTEDVYVGDCLCYSFAAEGRVNYISEWTDSAHRVVARSTGYPIARVICGPFESLASPNDFILSSGELAPGFTEHPVDLADPECGPWTNPTSRCEPGCCSGTPPKLPQTPN